VSDDKLFVADSLGGLLIFKQPQIQLSLAAGDIEGISEIGKKRG
jgi:hypothetical protein